MYSTRRSEYPGNVFLSLFLLFYRWVNKVLRQTNGIFGKLQDLKQSCGIGGLRDYVLSGKL